MSTDETTGLCYHLMYYRNPFGVLNMNATKEASAGKPSTSKRVARRGRTMDLDSKDVALFFEMAARQSLRTERERIEQISAGFEETWLMALKSAFNLSQESLATIANVSTTTLGRIKSGMVLSQVASERIDRVAQVAMLAAEVFEDESVAAQWMSKPHDLLGGVTPLSLCETELGARQVRRVLHGIEWGSAA
ncbi:MAG: MbcA/ParS/Xre antitoxin family protein [Pseudomonas profundi]|uniref:MbcA/ParS/Xre antitoxin family protein n=1 Tax=Pseudomonas profundi TaxID=1981513 RepID=UPI0030036173